MDSGVAALLGALLGGLLSWLATWSIEARRDRRQARSLAVAAASEIDAALTMVKARRWLEAFERALAAAQNGYATNLNVHVRDDYLPQCRAALAHAGLISRDLSVYLSRMITLVDGLTSDLKRMAEHPPGSPGALIDPTDHEGAANVYRDLIAMVDAGFKVGAEIVTFVDRKYPREISGYWSRVKAALRMLATGST
ncbi:hypothetical protein [Lysobacter sp. M15]|uniref:hypothetical protein n=1 Tax=Lysobacter sp. M15 TaxID=2916837 RepID=UPI001F55BA50|nr:hypothetical protein [Lysobacter sp. M15]